MYTKSRWWLTGAGEWEKWGDVGQWLQSYIHEMSKFRGPIIQHGD